MSDLPKPPGPERPYSASRIRGESDAGSLPRVDRGTEERLDPTVLACPPGQGGEIRVPDPARAPRQVERVLRPQGGDAVSGASAARGAGVRPEPVAGAGKRHASEVLPAHGPRADRAGGGARDLGRDDRRRRARPGGRPMTAPDEYLGQVRRAMAGMEPKVRDDILLELRSHIAESSAANGGEVEPPPPAVGSPGESGRGVPAICRLWPVCTTAFSHLSPIAG